jgi:pimeloyl-ACP methyl ester carboxylesterase
MRWPLLLLLLVASFSRFAASAGAAPLGSKVSWSPCYRDFGPFECGTVQVPLDHDEPGGASISIALVRLPATDPARRIGSLFLNPGGPGGSGVDFAVFAAQILFSDEVRARFDIVGFDPRGIGRSTALRCFGSSRQWAPYFTPYAFPSTPEEEAAWEAADRYLDAACDQRGKRIIDHMSTADVARDLDLLREAVGDEQLTYVGFSYGSYLGVTYANLFPERVRSVVVDGVLDPIAWSTGVPGDGPGEPVSTRIHSAGGAQATLQEFFRLCDAGGSNCAFGSGAANRFAALAQRLKSDPVQIIQPDGSSFQLNYSTFIGVALGAMYDSFSWPSFAEFLSAIESAAPASTLGARLDALWRSLGLITKRGFPEYVNFPEGFPGVLCADSDNPHAYAAWSAASAAEEARFGYFGPLWTWASSPCAAWPGGQEDRYLGPFDRNTAHPVLVMNTLYDPATRYQGAVTVAGLLPNSRLVTVAGWGHTTPFLSHAADDVVSRYLLDGTVPPAGTTFAQDFVPFSSPATLVASAAAAGKAMLAPALVPDVVRRLPNGRKFLDETAAAGAPAEAMVTEASSDVSPAPTQGVRPGRFELMPNYPNPFAGTTTLHFAVPERSQVRLSVFTLLGQEVARLVDGEVEPGYRSIQWNGVDDKGHHLPPGIYLYRMQARSLGTGEFFRAGKMTLMR